jgi:hypothetical protein
VHLVGFIIRIYHDVRSSEHHVRSITSFASVPEAARTHVFVRTCEPKQQSRDSALGSLRM